MKNVVSSILIAALSFLSFNSFATNPSHAHTRHAHHRAVEDGVTLHFFWSHNCPHCVAAHPFINKLKAQYPWLKVHEYEISQNPHNAELFEKMARDHGRETSFVPTFFVGDKMIVGYTSPSTTGSEIRQAVLAAHHEAK